ncbi:MAG: hypothetical protein H7288_15440 [Kineosporiaceae bacterium]|nr:hypothetical protein [Aeromicrobium sp.]
MLVDIVLILTGRKVGWSVLIFAGVRAVIDTGAVLISAPRITVRKSSSLSG